MRVIKNVVFDFGGVIVGLNRDRAVERFLKLGVNDADKLMDKYHQKGIFLEVEDGRIDANEFSKRLSAISGKELSFEKIQHAWLGFVTEVPQYKLDFLLELREKYRVYLLSNTNPFVMFWARSAGFTVAGKPLDNYVDKIYASYEVGVVKPERAIFEYMIKDASLFPDETLFVDDGTANIEMAEEIGFHTYLAKNEQDWRSDIESILNQRD